MAELLSWAGVAGVMILIGIVIACREVHAALEGGDTVDAQAGWVYFVTGGTDEMDTPIKIGMTHRDPAEDRLPEIRTMSPFPLRVIYKFRAPNAAEAEAKVHERLRNHRLHGEWFERDATLAFIDYLKGAYNWAESGSQGPGAV